MKKSGIFIIVIILLIAVGVGGYYFYKSKKSQKSSTTSQTNNTTPQESNQTQSADNQSNQSQSQTPAADSATTTPENTKVGDVTVGTVKQGDNNKTQQVVDSGDQPWRSDPVQVAQADGGDYGFQLNDDYSLISIDSSTHIAKVKVIHQGNTFIIELNQPVKQGNKGIWVIEKITQ